MNEPVFEHFEEPISDQHDEDSLKVRRKEWELQERIGVST